MKLCGKDYIIPELTFEHAEFLEKESGLSLYEVVFGKNNTMVAARVFCQICTGGTAEEVKAVLNEHIKAGGYKALGEILEAFVQAVFDSDFFCALLGLPTKAEREEKVQESEQENAPAET